MLGADAAVFVHDGVPLTLLRAYPASRGAHGQKLPREGWVRPALSGQHPAGSRAYVGTIQIQPDAIGQLIHSRLSQASVGTRRAELRAHINVGNGFGQAVGVGIRLRMSGEHLLQGFHQNLRLSLG